jgi:hypothetical protein
MAENTGENELIFIVSPFCKKEGEVLFEFKECATKAPPLPRIVLFNLLFI